MYSYRHARRIHQDAWLGNDFIVLDLPAGASFPPPSAGVRWPIATAVSASIRPGIAAATPRGYRRLLSRH